MPKNCLHTSDFFCYSYSPVTCTKQRYLKRPCCYCVKCFNCELGAVPLCLNGFALLCFPLSFQTPPEKQQRPKSLQLGDRRLTLSLFQGVSSQLSLSNPLSPLPASPHTPQTPRSSSMLPPPHTPPKKVKHCMSSFYFLLKLCLTHAETGGLRCVSTFWSEALIRSHTHLVFTDACGLKSFYFLSPVIGYSSLLTDNDVRTIDTPGTPPPMPPKKHPHEIDNSGFSTEVCLLRENLTHPLTNTYLMSCKR